MGYTANADLILVNGRVLTMDAQDTEAQALAIKDGRILAVGGNREIEALGGSETESIDLTQRVVLPGLADIHVHLASDAIQGDAVEVRDFFDASVTSIRNIQHRIRERSTQTPPGDWIIARGSPMQDLRLAEERWPDEHDLDEVAPDNPTYVSFGAHVIVANSEALKVKGVTRETANPQGGTVVKDPATGEPTGVLRERAQYLVKSRAAGQLDLERIAERILMDLQNAAMRGVTTVHDIVVNRDEVRAYQLLQQQGKLPVRVQILPRVIESNFSKESLLDLGLLQGFGSDWLKLGGIKMSIDGGFTGKNAAFSEPLAYHGNENPGLIRIQQEEPRRGCRAHVLRRSRAIEEPGDKPAGGSTSPNGHGPVGRISGKERRDVGARQANWRTSPCSARTRSTIQQAIWRLMTTREGPLNRWHPPKALRGGTGAGKSAQRACERSSDWPRGRQSPAPALPYLGRSSSPIRLLFWDNRTSD